MKIAVVGPGGIGGYLGLRLLQAGLDVTFLARGATYEALVAKGFRLYSTRGDFAPSTIRVERDAAKIGEVDVVFLTVKAWQMEEAATAARPMIGTSTVVLTIQNGVEAHLRAAQVLGSERVLIGLVRMTCQTPSPGIVFHVAQDPLLAFGEFGNYQSDRTRDLQKALAVDGLDVALPDSIVSMMWEKFVMVATWGGVGAVTGLPIGILRSTAETRDLMMKSMREVLQVARARRIVLAEDVEGRTIKAFDTLAPDAISTLQQDIAAGRPSELDARVGAVVRLGSEVRIPTPVNEVLFHCLLPLDMQARGTAPSLAS